MATQVFGPLTMNFGAQGLAPGQSFPTYWTTDPPVGGGTVTFTAFALNLAGDGGSLAIRDPTVQAVADGEGGLNITLLAVVANVGQSTVFDASMFISFNELDETRRTVIRRSSLDRPK
jgi:hypothetical protein